MVLQSKAFHTYRTAILPSSQRPSLNAYPRLFEKSKQAADIDFFKFLAHECMTQLIRLLPILHTHTSSSRSLQQPSVSYRPMDGLKYIWDRVTGIFRFSSAALYGLVYDRNRKKPNRNCQSFGRISTETEIRWHQNFHISRAQRNTFSYGRPNMRGEGSKNCVKTQNTVHYLKINLKS